MPKILVVDDSAAAHQFIARCLGEINGAEIITANNAIDGLACIDEHDIDLVVTDLIMDGMNGLDFVSFLQVEYPALPVILTTSQGSETMATLALKAGAVGYVAKRDIESELVGICENVLTLRADANRKVAVLSCNRSGQLQFELPSDPAVATGLAKHLQEITSTVMRRDDSVATRIGVALTEALLNAVIHGNLGISSELKERGNDLFVRAVEKRRREGPYRDRMVHVTFFWNESIISCSIRDEGNGFDPESLPDPTDPENLLKPHGRGVVLMKSFMDFVGYNAKGNEVTLTKHFTPQRPVSKAAHVAEDPVQVGV